uniref:Uncharacterized protein n=1 Tax=Panagrolaimus sp. JU765 TaxID=591449 RepID=A0AC34QHJ1_9BILA
MATAALRNRLVVGGLAGLVAAAGGYTIVSPYVRDVDLVNQPQNGFLTLSPTNLGSTVRGYVHIKLPILSSARQDFKQICDALSSQIRGADGSKLPEHVPYVLIGGGTASYYAALTIRAYDANAKILIISNESETPYNRGPLSKDLWLYGTPNVFRTFEYISAAGKKRDIRYESDGFFLNPGVLQDFEHGGVSLLRNRTAVELNPVEKEVILDNGKKVKFDKCLIATGGKPTIPFPFYSPHLRNKVMTYSRIADFQKLSLVVNESDSILIYGDDILAAELTYSLSARSGKKPKIVYATTENCPLKSIFPNEIAESIKSIIKSGNVDLLSGVKPIAVDNLPNGKVCVTLKQNGETHRVIVDHIIVADGMEPSVKIGKNSGLALDEKLGGIIADSKLQTSAADIYVAGDVAAYQDPLFGTIRVERWENAEITGRLAGQNMTGNVKEFHHRPAFVSKFGHDLHLSGVGQIDSSLKTISVFTPKRDTALQRGVVFYIKENKVVGVLLVNIFGIGLEIARKIISDSKEFHDFKELAKLFDFYEPSTPDNASDNSAVEEKSHEITESVGMPNTI